MRPDELLPEARQVEPHVLPVQVHLLGHVPAARAAPRRRGPSARGRPWGTRGTASSPWGRSVYVNVVGAHLSSRQGHRIDTAAFSKPCSTFGTQPELVSPAADLLHPLAAPQSGEETTLGRAPPGAQRSRDQFRRGVRPLQPLAPATVVVVLLRHSPPWPATSTTRTAGIPSPWSSLPAVRSRAPKP